jgi:hypothetical protein
MNTAAVAAFARLGELELYYETQGTGPPLVLIHGSRMTADLLNVAPDPACWPELVRKVLDLDAQPQDWPAAQIAAILAV